MFDRQQALASLVVLFLLTALSCGLASATALAGTAEEINSLSVLDSLNRVESPLSNGGKWSALAWASNSSGHATGRDTESGWGPYDAYSAVNGAYWSPSSFSDTSGSAVAITMQIAPGSAERYVSVWLDMASPGSAKSGYQLRWRALSTANTYKVTLSKWSSGTETVLAEQASVEIATGTTMAISDTGSTVTAWKGSGTSLTSVLSASDVSFSGGYAGVEGSGNISRSKDFKAGAFGVQTNPPDTTISAGPKGVVVPNVSFSFTASEQGASFECSLDAAAYSACTSPKSYQGLEEGTHTFRVRAKNGAGADETPAERSFQVVAPAKAAANVAVLDNLERQEVPLATGKWSKTSWAAAIGGTWMGSYRGYGSNGGLAGAYWNPTSFNDAGETLLVAGNVGTGSPNAGEYLALWLDMPSPASARSGYEARFSGVDGKFSNYKVELSKWVSGTRTVLASTSGFTLSVGTTIALTETSGGSLALWTGTSSLSPALTASDSTYTSGYAGLEVNGGAGTIYNFRTGGLASPPDTTISAGPKGVVVPNVSFSFTASEQGASFECSLDAAAYSACTSPKSYQGLEEGTHTFRVRAKNGAGADETPAERSFQVVAPAKAAANVAVLDNLERQEVPLATGKWSKATGTNEIGGAWCCSYYRGYGSNGGLAGAYWNPTSFNDAGETLLVAGNVGTGSPNAGEYLALWLDMPTPGGNASSGYEARFTGVNGSASNYKVELAKWVSNTRTVLASTSGFSLAVGTTMALTETSGGSLAIWTGTTNLSPVLSANDSAYASGYAGLDVNGGAGTIYNFRAGRIDIQPPDTTITSGPSGKVSETSASFSFTSTESGSTFECSLDGGLYVACASPKSYSGLTAGSHTFKVRAVDGVGNKDETPAERNFEVAQPPSATTAAAAEVKATSATLKGSVNPRGATTTYQFEYGTTTAYGNLAPATPKPAGSGTEAVEVSEPIAGLGKGTVYHYRLAATNGAGTTKGEDKTFTTTNVPLVTTEAATNISATEATLNGTVNPKGAATTYWFEYGPTISYGTKAPATSEGVGSGESDVAVSKQISGLTEGTAYHFRVAAQNEVGITYGPDLTVTSLVLPEATTEAATAVEPEEATLNGEVDPNGSETTYYFQYGPTTAYDSQAPLEGEEAGSGATGVEVEAAPELEPETTYHYRVVAVSPAGVDFGQDMTTTTATASAAGGDNNGEFVNLMWSGDWQKEGDPAHLKVVQKTGAKLLRVGLFEGQQGENWDVYNAIFCNAAKDGITILPGLYRYGGIAVQEQVLGNWKSFVREAVKRYGPGGSLWGPCGASRPVKYWEVFNEENWGENTGGKVVPHAFGEFFEATSGVINNAAESGNVQVILGGLLSVAKPKNEQEREQRMTPAEFIERMNMDHPSLIDAVGVHPYAFKVDGHEPRTHNQAVDLTEKIKLNIKEVHEVLPTTPLWVNEIGFTTEINDGSHLPVTEDIQAELIHLTIGMMERKSGTLNIHNVFYYNDWDDPTHADNWAYHCGLQKANGEFRKAFYAFTNEAHGDVGYPRKSRNRTKGHQAGAYTSSLYGMVDPEDLSSWYRFEYGKTTGYGQTTAWEPAGFEAGERDFSSVATGLTPETTYHYRIVSKNENLEYTYGEDEQLTTKPAIETHLRSLNGEPGWINVNGTVDSVTGAPINGVEVNINFKKKENGTYVFNETESTHAKLINGNYSLENWKIGRGEWQVNVVFPGQGENPRSETGLEPFTIKNAYHLVAQHSGKCLEVSYGSSENGMSIHQEPCGDGHTQQAQAFTLVPSPYNPIQYEIVNRNSGKCLDVKDVSQADGAPIQQYTCLGWGQSNQIFEGVPVSTSDTSHVKYIAQHSHKCLDITGASTANGALLEQWSCTGGSNQSFGFESVEADPVPTHAYVTPDAPNATLYGHPGYESLHGSVEAPQSVAGQYVNVNFKKRNSSGVYEYIDTIEPHPTLDSEGKFSYSYWGVGAGEWEVVVVYPGFGNLAESRTVEGTHRFHVGDGYRFEFRQSNKCVSTSGGGTSNGTAIIQWDCDANYSNWADGQVYSVKPVAPAGSNYFEVIPDSNTNMCLDVAGGPSATQNGAVVQLWQCLGESQTNQIWHIVELASPNQGWFAFIAKHSGRCMTVSENSTANGARFLQWDCAWAGSQQWRWLPVG